MLSASSCFSIGDTRRVMNSRSSSLRKRKKVSERTLSSSTFWLSIGSFRAETQPLLISDSRRVDGMEVDVIRPPTLAPEGVVASPRETTFAATADQLPLPQHMLDSKTAVSAAPESKLAKYWRCFKIVHIPAFELAAVYFCGYVIFTGMASGVMTRAEACVELDKQTCMASDRCEYVLEDPLPICQSKDFVRKNAYAIFAFCYQGGVFISRASKNLFSIKRVEYLALLQFVNMILWILQNVYKVANLWTLFPIMFLTGIFGGASYVNIYAQIISNRKVQQSDREICVSFSTICSSLGITLASTFIILMDNTFLANA
eukprot:m.191207 g.191207  ORF g.191207 m.191207 type:complete len:316 (+) comp53635_c0_seq2:782-1729(+)